MATIPRAVSSKTDAKLVICRRRDVNELLRTAFVLKKDGRDGFFCLLIIP